MAAALELIHLLQTARKHAASDVHVVVGLPPLFRVDGEVVTGKGESLSGADLVRLVEACTSAEQRARLLQERQLCFSTLFGVQDRARVTVYLRNGFPELSIRVAERVLRSREELGLPAVLDELVRRPHGLLLITGPTGSGKTTTFHYLVHRINEEQRKKLITIEDPIEYVHLANRSLVVQQEVGTDVLDFASALKHVLRQDPDVIGVGELLGRETIHTALVAAETGHLVLGTLHTPDTVQVVQRVLGAFGEGSQAEVRQLLANSLLAVVSQQLLPRATGGGRVLCHEVLIGTPAVRHLIREGEVHKLYSEIQAGRRHGMVTMDHSLLERYGKGDITYDTAVTMARFPEAIQRRLG